MTQQSFSPSRLGERAYRALWAAFARERPDVRLDAKGYMANLQDQLLPLVRRKDFEAELGAGAGDELGEKFRAVHSSAALAVNCFAPFRTRLAALRMPTGAGFTQLEFERQCPSGLRGVPPHLDVLLSGADVLVAIESKLTEYLSQSPARFAASYKDNRQEAWRDGAYFRELLRLEREPDYAWLNAAQLVKHAFGLAHTFRGERRKLTLLYLYWEPANPDCDPTFARHRQDLQAFAARVQGANPAFSFMSYRELWRFWEAQQPADWLVEHIGRLRARYDVRI